LPTPFPLNVPIFFDSACGRITESQSTARSC
jgi:hypothetical protein